ncbi:MAG: hypothetical protein Q8S73_36770 [Deltaproteobacteria bacterium]|nr:hypothetical protein [Myxococcales bacterium]MDP3219713.1 hypothetical protein [Deltaproteobacteria bacterium]
MRLFLWRYAAALYRLGAAAVLAGAALALFVHLIAGAVLTALGLATMAVTHARAGA